MMIDGIAILAVMFGFCFMLYAYLKCRKENETLREKMDISVMKEQAREKVLMEKIEGMELPFFARDNTSLKTGYDLAKKVIIRIMQEVE